MMYYIILFKFKKKSTKFDTNGQGVQRDQIEFQTKLIDFLVFDL